MGRQIKLVAGAALFVLLVQPTTYAAEKGRLAWHTDVNEAWKITKKEGRPLLVFVTHDHCVHCVKMKNGTFAEQKVAAAVMKSYVPLAVDGAGKTPLVKDLAVSAYPTTFLISPDAVVLGRIEGYVPPDVLMARLAALKNVRPPGKIAQARVSLPSR